MAEGARGGLVTTGVASLMAVGCGLITGVLTARMLLPEGRGTLAALLFWPQWASIIAALSINESVTYRVSTMKADVDRVVATGLWLSVTIALLFAGVAASLLPYLLGVERSDYVLLGQAYMLAFVPLTAVSLAIAGMYRGRMEFRVLNLLRLCAPFVYLLTLLALWALGRISVESVMLASFLGTAAAAALGILMWGRRGLLLPSKAEVARLLGLCWQFHPAALLLLIATQMDRIALVSLFEDVDIGLYVVALTAAATVLNIVTQSFATVIFPAVSRRQEESAKKEVFVKSLRYSMALMTLITVPLLAALPWLLPLVFGDEFESAAGLSVLLAVAYVPQALRQIAIRGLRGFEDGRPGTIAELTAVTVFAVLFWPLTGSLGLAGIALALFLANIASFGYLVVYLRRKYALRFVEYHGFRYSTIVGLLSLLRAQLVRGRSI